MTVNEVTELLRESGIEVIEQRRLPNDTGTQLRTDCGAIVNVFDKGTYTVQGKKAQEVKLALNAATSATRTSVREACSKVFVVYGHDVTARSQLEAMLRRWGLEPLILDQLPSEGQTVIEKLESYTADVGFGVVLATPDDEGNRVGHSDERAYRARQNVVLELGMLLAPLGRKKVAILLRQQENMERPSDIQGLIYIPFRDDLQREAGVLLAKEMNSQEYQIRIADL